ncbi:MAG: glycosyltransferase, partial [Phenylobacterium sp.]|nr:glycosyltransferase [Phenylobacterium sp.]
AGYLETGFTPEFDSVGGSMVKVQQNMARLTAEADIGIGAPGSATWERCVLGLPSILVVLAENQRANAQAMADREAAIVLDLADPGFDEAMDRALWRLLRDPDLRRDLARRSAETCDGLGAGRTAEAFLALIASRSGVAAGASGGG